METNNLKGRTPSGRLPKSLAGFVITGTLVLLWSGVASAHAFLVSTNPAPGSRLTSAPTDITLRFSEAVDVAASRVSLTVLGSKRGVPLHLHGLGTTILATIPGRISGIDAIHWSVTSLDDGHVTSGTFYFAVGNVDGSIPESTFHSSAPNALRVWANWFFFVGLALAAGTLTTALLVDTVLIRRFVFVRAGLLISIIAAVLGSAALFAHGVTAAAPRVIELEISAALLLAAALVTTLFPFGSWLTLLIVGGSGFAWSGSGHGAARFGVIGWILTAVHLLSAAVWSGALFQFVLHVRRSAGSNDSIWSVAKRYERIALWTVTGLISSGVVLTINLLSNLRSLFFTSYGQLILLKGSLLLVALGLALAGKLVGVKNRRRGILWRLVRTELGLLGAILLASSLLVELGPPPIGMSAASVLGVAPLTGPIEAIGGLAGYLTVGISANGAKIIVQVFAGDTQEPGTLIRTRVSLGGTSGWRSLHLNGCGPGCASGPLELSPGATRVSVTASAKGWVGGDLVKTLYWPPTPLDPMLLTRMIATMMAVPSLQVTEQVSSGRFHAPSKTFHLTGSQFMTTEPYSGPTGPGELNSTAEDVRSLPGVKNGFSFDLGLGHLWATVELDAHGRISSEVLVNAGDEIKRTFIYGGVPG